MTVLAIIAAIGGVITAFFFRKGGIYNPIKAPEIPDPPKVTTPPVEPPKTPIIAPQPYPKATIENLCLAIRDFEGLKLNPKTGQPDQNWRLNNPGNARYSKEGYLKIYEPVKISKNGFAIFKDYDTGWLYLKNMLKNKIKKHPDWTLYDLINNYAPPEDDNPVDNYARFVAKRLDVDISYEVKNLV